MSTASLSVSTPAVATELGGVHVTPTAIQRLALGYGPTLLVEAALRHGIFDLLDNRPHTVEQICTAKGLSERGLRSILHALVALEFLTKDVGGRFALTPV